MEITKVIEQDKRFMPFLCLVIAVILLVADYFSGPFIQFPITYLIPIGLASWYNGVSWGLSFAIGMPIIRLLFNVMLWTIPWTWVEASVNCVIRIAVFSVFVILADRTARQAKGLEKEVKILNGLLPICSYCKRIRDESGGWQSLELYISDRSEASFSHGVCPDCSEKYFGEYLKSRK